jgi:hypothetical protein
MPPSQHLPFKESIRQHWCFSSSHRLHRISLGCTLCKKLSSISSGGSIHKTQKKIDVFGQQISGNVDSSHGLLYCFPWHCSLYHPSFTLHIYTSKSNNQALISVFKL